MYQENSFIEHATLLQPQFQLMNEDWKYILAIKIQENHPAAVADD